ncbi:MAG: hypothetical protein ABTR92_19650 [Candidatus Accumulibacter phosphatis]
MSSTAAPAVAAVSASAAGLSLFGISTGLHIDLLLAGFAGALFALSFDDPKPFLRRGLVTLSSACVAAYITPLSVVLFRLQTPLPDEITQDILLPAVAVAGGFLSRRLLGPAAFKLADKLLEKI